MDSPVAVVLAAGKSTRMKSACPKVLHEVCGRPMIEYVLDAARAAGVTRLVVIVGHEAHQVERALSRYPDVEFALQAEQRGTGHAVIMCAENLRDHNGPVMVLTGDAPLMQSRSFAGLLDDFHRFEAACVVGTARTAANFGLGRIVRDSNGEFLRIVEEKDASPEEKAIQEINVGCYVFDCQPLFAALQELRPNNKQGELYLTDCAAILKQHGKTVVASPRLEIAEALGVNTRAQLAEVEQTMQREIQERHMAEGVTIVSPAQTFIDSRAQIGRDTILYPFTAIVGPAVIGTDCRVGHHTVVDGAHVSDGTTITPFQHVRGER